MQDELDKNLRSLFEEKRHSLPDGPFIDNTLRLIKRRHSLWIFMRRLASVAVLACCALLSPLLIKGSMVLSGELNDLFGAVNGFVNTRAGVTTAALCALLLLLFNRRQVSRFV